jgi:predicted PurR-regulated permease PerM
VDGYHRLTFRLFTAGITLAFLWILSPFAGAILWSVVFAILFTGLKERIAARIGGRNGLASLLTLLVMIVLVIVPVFLLVGLVLSEAAQLYQHIKSGDVNLAALVGNLLDGLPGWAKSLLQDAGLGSQSEALETLSNALSGALSWLASFASGFGQSALGLVIAFGVTLYLTYFLLMDGHSLARRIGAAVPIDHRLYDRLIHEFASVVRAMVKGSLVVAAAQGLIGGVVFAILGIQAAPLWGALMGVMALIPAVGTGIVWIPVTLYLLVTGSFVDALILTFCGIFIIGMVDNLLRPILVGRETRMPDYLVLISTLGGISVAGFSGLILGPIVSAMFLVVWNTRLDSPQPVILGESG